MVNVEVTSKNTTYTISGNSESETPNVAGFSSNERLGVVPKYSQGSRTFDSVTNGIYTCEISMTIESACKLLDNSLDKKKQEEKKFSINMTSTDDTGEVNFSVDYKECYLTSLNRGLSQNGHMVTTYYFICKEVTYSES